MILPPLIEMGFVVESRLPTTVPLSSSSSLPPGKMLIAVCVAVPLPDNTSDPADSMVVGPE